MSVTSYRFTGVASGLFKKSLLVALAISVAPFMSTVANADDDPTNEVSVAPDDAPKMDIDATNSLSSRTPQKGSEFTSSGWLKFNPWVGSVPIPSKICLEHSFPVSIAGRPRVIATDWGSVKPFAIKWDPVVGKNQWVADSLEEKWIADVTEVRQTAAAKAEMWGTGPVRYGTGTGHPLDRNAIAEIKVV